MNLVFPSDASVADGGGRRSSELVFSRAKRKRSVNTSCYKMGKDDAKTVEKSDHYLCYYDVALPQSFSMLPFARPVHASCVITALEWPSISCDPYVAPFR